MNQFADPRMLEVVDAGGSALPLILGLGVGFGVLGVLAYVWYAIALSKLFPRLEAEGWKGWVPVLNEATILSLGGRPAWNVVFLLLPIVQIYGLYLKIVAVHRINQRFGRGAGMTVLGVLLPPLWATVLAIGPLPYPEGDRLAGIRPGPLRRSADAGPLDPAQGFLAPPILPPAPVASSSASAPHGEGRFTPGALSQASPVPGATPSPAIGVPASTAGLPGDSSARSFAPHNDVPAPSFGPPPAAPVPDFAPREPVAEPAASPAPLPPAGQLIDSVPWASTPSPSAPPLPPPASATHPGVPAPTPAPPAPTVAHGAAAAPVEQAAAPTPIAAPNPAPVPSVPQPSAPAPSLPESSAPAPFVPDPAVPASSAPEPSAPEPAAAPAPGPVAGPDPAAASVPAGSAASVFAAPVHPGASSFATGGDPVEQIRPVPVVLPGQAISDRPETAPSSDADGVPADDHEFDATVVVPRRRGVRRVLVLDDGRSFALSATSIVIGRNPEGEPGEQRLAIPDRTRTLSKTHARLVVQGEEWRLTDLHSTNGVVVVADDGAETLLDAGESVIGAGRFILGEVGMHVAVESGS